jgi:tripartite-type tricarboxylate transporter receptor subunit TctC
MRRVDLRLPLMVLLGMVGSLPAAAQNYPTQQIRIVLPFAPGGATDFLARLSAEGLSAQSGQQVIVDNRPGAGGNPGAEAVVKAQPDGYTLLFVPSGNIVINPFLYKTMPFNPITDLVPVFNVGEAPQLMLIPATLPAKSLQEFITLAKSKPGGLNYASAGSGSITHLAVLHFERLSGTKLVHVPYKGAGPAIPDLIAERVQLLSVSLGTVSSQLRAGTIRAIATASPKRLTGAPDIPTSAEAGLPGFELSVWFGLFAPRGVSPATVRYLNEKLQTVIDMPQNRKRMLDAGVEPAGGSAESFAALIREDHRKFEPIVRASGATVD